MPLTDTTRKALSWMVEREEATTGSRITAYQNIADAIGASSSWLRHFIAGDGASEPRLSLFESIVRCYVKMCERVEREHADELRRIELMRGELHAADRGFREVVRRTHRAVGA